MDQFLKYWGVGLWLLIDCYSVGNAGSEGVNGSIAFLRQQAEGYSQHRL
jgi:hypothetical protein